MIKEDGFDLNEGSLLWLYNGEVYGLWVFEGFLNGKI